MADVVRRSGLHVRFRCELYTGRRLDVDRLRRRLALLLAPVQRTISYDAEQTRRAGGVGLGAPGAPGFEPRAG